LNVKSGFTEATVAPFLVSVADIPPPAEIGIDNLLAPALTSKVFASELVVDRVTVPSAVARTRAHTASKVCSVVLVLAKRAKETRRTVSHVVGLPTESPEFASLGWGLAHRKIWSLVTVGY
jgi:hypothetical protein